MRQLKLAVTSRWACPILIEHGILQQSGRLIQHTTRCCRAVVITDSVVGPLYADKVMNSLAESGIQSRVITVPSGEAHKALDTAAGLFENLSGTYTDRSVPVIALGGGMIGDLAGFVAATYMRGLPLVHIPTSLLAQVDSSIGGKTAVNYKDLKNQIGSFYQPCLVITDPGVLSTLPGAEFTGGMAEVIKSAAIFDAAFFSFLETRMDQLAARHPGYLEKAIYRSVRIKAQIVSRDERDRGLRQILNFGHTVGHAIESCSGFCTSHGSAVALGMIAASRISCWLDLQAESDYQRLKALVARAGLPVNLPDLNPDLLVETIKHDKKIKDGSIDFILLTNPGAAVISRDVTLDLIKRFWLRLMNSPRICTVITSADSTILRQAETQADLVELRLDLIGETWMQLAELVRLPWIATCRTCQEGGVWEGNETRRIEILLQASRMGARYVDIEISTPNIETLAPLIKSRSELLISHHDFTCTPGAGGLTALVDQMFDCGADIIKIATMANCIEDNIRLIELPAKYPGKQIVAINMGAQGILSRVMSPVAGSAFTYASASTDLETVSGQIDTPTLKKLYKALQL
jgi:3-dehydroquinate synthase